jgi:hypothetical protein
MELRMELVNEWRVLPIPRWIVNRGVTSIRGAKKAVIIYRTPKGGFIAVDAKIRGPLNQGRGFDFSGIPLQCGMLCIVGMIIANTSARHRLGHYIGACIDICPRGSPARLLARSVLGSSLTLTSSPTFPPFFSVKRNAAPRSGRAFRLAAC